MENTKRFLTRCVQCYARTTKHYARAHGGLCKACYEASTLLSVAGELVSGLSPRKED